MERGDVIADVRNFMKSRVILTAAELNLFTHLHEKSSSAKKLADQLKLNPRALTRLLDALVTFGLVKKHHTRYFLTDQGLLLSSHHRETILPFVLHLNTLWDSWSHLTGIVKNGPYRKPKAFLGKAEEDQKAFIGAMHVVGRKLAQEIAEAYDLKPFKRLLDIGGGSGTYSIAFLRNNPSLKGIIFDLKNVIPMAEERIKAEGLSDRLEPVAGDFYHDELPRGCDLALLSAIIHQNSPEQNRALYRKIFQALLPEGRLLIRDFVMDESRTHPPEGALFAINMLVNTPGGDTYTFQEIKHPLEQAGFMEIKIIRPCQQIMDCLVEAKKPSAHV
ncbi:MAG TPA: methyltransferase [Thermodesulfobacteriota bacterium]|nr:methyltransferase [Thermodesulfobacteriota bacterium]